MHKATIKTVLDILNAEYPTLAMHDAFAHNPFFMLVAIVLSQRSRDKITVPTAQILFSMVSTPQELLSLPTKTLEKVISPIGMAPKKAHALQQLSQALIASHHGKVPTTEKELHSLPQVGRKTANIMLTTFFHTPKIAVDIHVHRITNRLGWVHTSSVETTEHELTDIVPHTYHKIVNRVFVAHGQHICLPRHPKCSVCPIEQYCQKIGVK